MTSFPPIDQEPEEDDVDGNIRRNNYKLTADKIKQILGKVLNDPSKSYRRWIWELMQNAKDVPNTKFGRVSIQIVLAEDQVQFKHNGDPFVTHNITGLIQQVSSKASDSSDEEVTGKFGTGFISTHLLSDIIGVSGIIRHKGTHRRFNIELDRSGRTSEELLPKIAAALEHIRKIEDDKLFPVVPNYKELRREDELDTVFTYNLTSDEKKKAARAGIADLVHTLPVTLVNIPKIKRVEVCNQLDGTRMVYECHETQKIDSIRKIKVAVDTGNGSSDRYFIGYKADHLELIAEVDNFSHLKLKEAFGKQPNIYRDFPLVGSENFYFPFLLNGTGFFPTEDRDSIYLNSVESPEAASNRQILESAIQASLAFTQWLIQANATNRWICAYSRRPDYKWEESAKVWYTTLQKAWRTQLLDLPIVETEAGTIILLRDAIVPNYGATKEARMEFYKIAASFLGKQTVPREDLLLNWIEATGPKEELPEWNHTIQCDLKQLLAMLQEVKNLTNLATEGSLGEGLNPTTWLNSLYSFIHAQGQSDLLNEYAVIPNQYGNFNLLNKLSLIDATNPIPEHFLDVLKHLAQDWRLELIDRTIVLAGLNIKTRSLTQASETINDILQKSEKNTHGVFEYVFLQRSDALSIISSILSVFLLDHTGTSSRYQLFVAGKELFQFDNVPLLISGVQSFEFRNASKLFIQLINNKISACQNLNNLGVVLGKDDAGTLKWLDQYLNLLKENADYSSLLSNGNIIPDRNGDFGAYDDIANFGSRETPLNDELLLILKKLNPKKDWSKKLVHDGITIQLPNTTKFEELGLELETEIKRIQGEEAHEQGSIEQHREAILELIEWCGTNKRISEEYLSHIDNQSSRLFFTLTVGSKQISKEVLSLLKDEKSIELLTDISNSNLDHDKVRELLGLAQDLGSVDKLLEHAKELIREQEDFQFKLQIGNQIEELFKQALIQEGVEIDVIRYQGVGSNDFTIENKTTGKKFFIELKSYRATNTQEPIKLAMSQAKLATNAPESFALAVIPRPEVISGVTTHYIREQLKYLKELHQDLQHVIDAAGSISQIVQSSNPISLEIKDPSCKIKVSHGYINDKRSSFDKLLSDIKVVIGQN